MPYTIDLSRYGTTDLDGLARIAGTVQGEAGNQDIFGRAMVVDNALNRTRASGFPSNNQTLSNGDSYTGVAAQLMAPRQYSTWNPNEASYGSAVDMYNTINAIGADPTYFDRLSPATQQQVVQNLNAIRGVMGTGVLQGISGGATFYSTGNPASFGPGRYDEHVGYGLGVAKAENPLIGGEYWYGGDPANTQAIYQRINGFDKSGALDRLYGNPDPGYQPGPRDVPLPPGRPSDEELGLSPSPGPLDQFSDAITQGLQGAGTAFGNAATGFGNALNQGLGSLFGAQMLAAPGAYDFGAQYPATNPFGQGGADFGDFEGLVPPTPQAYGGFGGQFDAPQFSLPPGFGAPQAPYASGFASPLYSPTPASAASDFGAPDLQGVDPNAGFNPSGFLNAGFGSFGTAPQFGQGAAALSPWTFNGGIQQPGPITGDFGLPQMQGVNVPPMFGNAPQLSGNFDLSQLSPIPGYDGNVAPDAFAGGFNPNGFFGASNGGFGIPELGGSGSFPSAAAPTLGPDAFASAYGGGFPSVSPLGPDAFASPFGGGGFNARTLGFNGAAAPTFGFTGQNAFPGFFGSEASTLGPDQFATAADQDAPAPDPYGFSGLNFGAGLGAQPQGLGGAYGFGAAPASNPFGGRFGSGYGIGFGGGFNPGGFLGAGAQGFGDLYGAGHAPAAPPAPAPDPYGFNGGNFGAGLGAQPQSFGSLFGMPAAPTFNPFGGGIGGFGGFGGGFDAGGGLGATPQGFGSLYGGFGAAPASAAPAPDMGDPWGFSGTNVGGFDANAGAGPAPAPAPAPEGFGGGSIFGGGFNPDASENAFLRGQMANNAAMQQAGQAPQASNPNLYPSLFAAITPTPTNGTSYIAPQPNFAPAPGFSAPVSYAAPQVSLMMPAPQINIPTMNFSGGGFGGLGGFL